MNASPAQGLGGFGRLPPDPPENMGDDQKVQEERQAQARIMKTRPDRSDGVKRRQAEGQEQEQGGEQPGIIAAKAQRSADMGHPVHQHRVGRHQPVAGAPSHAA